MLLAMDALHKPRPQLDPPVSLQQLGYSDVGLDGGWARCEGVNGSYHDAAGQLLVNETRFPSFASMNAYAHARNLTSSFYLNCDQCVTTEGLVEGAKTDAWYAADARFAAELAFDGIKFDTQPGGPNWNISLWSQAVRAAGRPMVLEDCLDKHPDGSILKRSNHSSIDVLHDPAYCPFDFYRVGGDNSPRWLNGMGHMVTDLTPFLEVTTPERASRPGCWAYPDMLAIGAGVMQRGWLAKGCPALRPEEERSLFSAWAVVSSPLILSFDITVDSEVERLWPLIANERVLGINAQWAAGARGEAGHVLKRARQNFTASACGNGAEDKAQTLPAWVVWAKRLDTPPRSVAVLAVNVADSAQAFDISLDELREALALEGVDEAARARAAPAAPTTLVGTDVWTGREAAQVSGDAPWHVSLPHAHDSQFLVFTEKHDAGQHPVKQ
eukprot:g108.t1